MRRLCLVVCRRRRVVAKFGIKPPKRPAYDTHALPPTSCRHNVLASHTFVCCNQSEMATSGLYQSLSSPAYTAVQCIKQAQRCAVLWLCPLAPLPTLYPHLHAYDRPAANDDLLWPAIPVGRSEKPAWRLPTWMEIAVLVLQALTCVAVCSCAFAQWRDQDPDWGNDTLHMRMSAFAHFANRIFD
jgi:hypothetical protein